MSEIRNVCVYCGSGPGTNPVFMQAATALGRTLAENGVRLIYGGGSLGMMGAVAAATLAHGGKVTGIIPTFLRDREHAMTDVQELIVTRGRHRKPILLGNIDGFWEPFLALIAHMRELAFIRAGLSVDVLTADRVEDMLPKLRAAAADVGPIETLLQAGTADGL